MVNVSAQWTNQFKFVDGTGLPLTNRTVMFIPRSAPQTNSLTNIISGDRLRFVTDTNGSNQIILYRGSYDVRLFSTSTTGETLFTIAVPSGTGRTNGANLISPIIDPSAQTGYTRAQADARYLMAANGAATNLTTTNSSHNGTFRGSATITSGTVTGTISGDGSGLTNLNFTGGSATNAISKIYTNSVLLAAGVTNLNLRSNLTASYSGGTVTVDTTGGASDPLNLGTNIILHSDYDNTYNIKTLLVTNSDPAYYAALSVASRLDQYATILFEPLASAVANSAIVINRPAGSHGLEFGIAGSGTPALSIDSPSGNITANYGLQSATFSDGGGFSTSGGSLSCIDISTGAISAVKIHTTLSTVTYASTISLAVGTYDKFKTTTVHATGAATINAASGGTAGETYTIIIVNDSTSGKIITFGTNFKTIGSLTGTVNKTAVISFESDGTNLYERSRVTGL